MKARDIMVTEFPIVSVKTSVREATRMLHNSFGDERFLNAAPGLVVLNEKGELAGILSPLTIINALLHAAPDNVRPAVSDSSELEDLCSRIKDKLVEDIMDWQSISVTEDADILDVADLFVQNRFQRIPVVKNREVTGIIYRSRVLFAMAACLIN
jgi:CBS domain-containing protein